MPTILSCAVTGSHTTREHRDGALREPTLFQSITGVKYGFPPGSETMLYAKSLLPPTGNGPRSA